MLTCVYMMRYLPQEIEVWYIIPAIRREISKCLIKEHNISYEKVGKILGVSKAAVSQYLKGKRAGKIKLPKELNTVIAKSCRALIKSESPQTVDEINKIIGLIRNKSLPCSVCGRLREGVLDDCTEIRFKDGNYFRWKIIE